jgi:adenylate cyclase
VETKGPALTLPAETANLSQTPDKPSIAVLPFQNMSGDPEQEYFADGIVEEIITALSRFRSLLVIARNTSFTYKGKAVDIKQVGRELGVRYVLEGSVRKAGGRVRITGQLIEAATGAHLWADKVDGALEDVFDLQDQVTSSVVGAIAPAMQFAETERTKRKPTADLDSYDMYLRGSAAVWEGRLKDAISYFKKAIEKDDRYAEAYGLCAGAYVVLQSYGGITISPEETAEALRFADMAATLGTDDALTLVRAAQALVSLGNQYERGLAMTERAVALNPNLSTVWLVRGWVNLTCGKHEEARNSFSRVLRFSELDPARIGACSGISWSCFHLGKYEEGCTWAAKALQKYENALYLCPLIINAVRAGRKEEARKAAERLLELVPGCRVSGLPYARRHGSVGEALRAAGLPE